MTARLIVRIVKTMSNSTRNRVVLLTGASSGIGKATAQALAAEGYTVYAAARRLEKMADLEPLGCVPVKMDVTKEEDVVAVVERIAEERGGIDILINNAGISLYGSLEESPMDKGRYQFEVNFFGPMRLTQLVLPHMRQQRWGKVVNISSGEGRMHMPLAAWYVASKFAIEGMSDCLRVETQHFGIDVIVVEPGAIDTPIMDGFVDPLLEISGHGPYRNFARKMADWFRNLSAEKGTASPPSVIADVIVSALRAPRPRTRYMAGVGVTLPVLVRRFLGDRVYDRLVLREFG